jgi:hypothetical protein
VIIGGLLFAATTSTVYAQANSGLNHYKCYGLLVAVPTDPPNLRKCHADHPENGCIGSENCSATVEKHFRGTISPIADRNHHLTLPVRPANRSADCRYRAGLESVPRQKLNSRAPTVGGTDREIEANSRRPKA